MRVELKQFIWFLLVILYLTSPSADCLSLLPIFFDSTNHWHRDIEYHPEQAERIQACIQAILDYKKQTTDSSVHLVDVAPEEAAEEAASESSDVVSNEPFSTKELNHARAMLVEAHSEDYVFKLEQKCRNSRQRRLDGGKNPLGFIGYLDEGDTFLTTESYDVCLRATAAWIRAVNVVLDDDKDNDTDIVKAAMALTRPPGHHATASLANGFCIFNFAAAAALHVIHHYPSIKVSILDWDVHYGQGVADIVQHKDRIRYVSIHQTQAFPYQGETRRIFGQYSNILTIPIAADNTWTCGYKQYFHNVALPFVQSDEWQPDLVIVCAGYDALASDELASVSLTAPDYGEMTRGLVEHVCKDRRDDMQPGCVVLGLEGGYQLREGIAGGNLADAVLETVRALIVEEQER